MAKLITFRIILKSNSVPACLTRGFGEIRTETQECNELMGFDS